MPQPLDVKCFLNGVDPPDVEIRRFVLESETVGNYDHFVDKILSLYPKLTDRSYSLTYEDRDGDRVTFSSDGEFLDALTFRKVREDGLFCVYIRLLSGTAASRSCLTMRLPTPSHSVTHRTQHDSGSVYPLPCTSSSCSGNEERIPSPEVHFVTPEPPVESPASRLTNQPLNETSSSVSEYHSSSSSSVSYSSHSSSSTLDSQTNDSDLSETESSIESVSSYSNFESNPSTRSASSPSGSEAEENLDDTRQLDPGILEDVSSMEAESYENEKPNALTDFSDVEDIWHPN